MCQVYTKKTSTSCIYGTNRRLNCMHVVEMSRLLRIQPEAVSLMITDGCN